MSDGVDLVIGKPCTWCRDFKPLDHYYPSKLGKYGLQSRCKPCCNQATVKARLRTPEIAERQRAYDRAYYRKSLHAKKRITDASFLKRYGITRAQFEEQVARQGGLCAICKKEPVGEGNHASLFQDHCHVSGRNRDALCGTCNSGLGMFGDNPAILRAAANYVEGWENVGIVSGR